MRRRSLLLAALAVLLLAGGMALLWLPGPDGPREDPAASGPSDGASARAAVPGHVAAFLGRHCTDCHGEAKQEGGLRLDTLSADLAENEAARGWQEVLDRLNREEMPPPERDRPDPAEQQRVVRWITAGLRTAPRQAAAEESGAPLRRLTRTEYANTVRDLLHLRFLPGEDPRELLPPDGALDGLDKVGAGLRVDPSLLEAYAETATVLADKAIVRSPRPPVATARLRFEFEETAGNPYVAGIAARRSTLMRPDGLVLMQDEATTPPLRHPHNNHMVPVKGWYAVRVRAGADRGERKEPVRMQVWRPGVGATLLQTEVDAPLDRPRVYEATLPLTPDGADGLAVFLLNGTSFRVANLYWHQMEGEIGRLAEAGKDREAARLRAARRAEGAASHSRPNPATLHTAPLPRLFLDYVEIEGPLYEQWPPRSHQALLEGAGEARDLEAGRRVLARLARRAFRRPLSEAELEPLVGVVARELRRGEPFEEALKAGVVAVLCSPRFLYLSSAPSGDAHALATRLSYFLWSSMPDDELFELAEAGTLGEPGTLDRQVNRMLRDPRADALATDFAAQWLKVREFDRFRPDEELYPAYHRAASAGLGEALKAEPLQFFREVLRSDLDVRCFLEADWAMVNEPLARFYGLEGVKGDEFRKVALPPGSPRGGLLGMAGVHQWGSDGSRTRPVERGKYILDVLLGDPPPPPPPNAGEVEPNVPGQLLTVRQRLERHQQIPACAACHRRIDPYGLALENWSAIGQWRQRQDGERRNWGDAPPVDASGQLPDGRRFADFLEFRRLLRGEAGRFERALAEKLFVYALGRRLGPADRPEVDRLVARMQASGHTLRTLLKAIVSSETFRTP